MREGDEPARRLLECLPLLRRWLAPRVAGERDRDDLEQEILAAAWAALPGFRGDSSLSTWLHGIAKRVLWRYYGTSSRRPLSLDGEASDGLPLRADDAEDRAFEDRLCIDMLIERLPRRDARLFELFYRERLSVVEIARASGEPEGTVKYRLFCVRRRLSALSGR